MPSAVWLTSFFEPQSFLTSMLLSHSRVQNIPVEELRFETSVPDIHWDWHVGSAPLHIPSSIQAPASGCLVYGLYMQGATWAPGSRTLAEAHTLGLTPVPVLHLNPVQIPPVVAKGPAPPQPQPSLASTQSAGPPQPPPSAGTAHTPAIKMIDLSLYSTSQRNQLPVTNRSLGSDYRPYLVRPALLLQVALPSSMPASHWLKRGTVLVAQNDA